MSGSFTFREKFKALFKNYEYLDKKNEYLKKKFRDYLKNKKRALHYETKAHQKR